AVIVPFGLYLRRSLLETLHLPASSSAAPAPVSYPRIGLVSIALLATATTNNYLLSYMTTYANSTLGMSERLAFGATVAVGAAGLVCNPVAGWMSDHFGRRRLILWPWVICGLLVFP